jgi:hypothetical protein
VHDIGIPSISSLLRKRVFTTSCYYDVNILEKIMRVGAGVGVRIRVKVRVWIGSSLRKN